MNPDRKGIHPDNLVPGQKYNIKLQWMRGPRGWEPELYEYDHSENHYGKKFYFFKRPNWPIPGAGSVFHHGQWEEGKVEIQHAHQPAQQGGRRKRKMTKKKSSYRRRRTHRRN